MGLENARNVRGRNSEQPRKVMLSRRNLLKAAIGAALAGSTYIAYKESHREKVPEIVPDFEGTVRGFRELYEHVHADQILFLDGDGRPLHVVDLQPIDNISPGTKNAFGIIAPEKISPHWMAAAERSIRLQNGLPPTEKLHHLSVTRVLREFIRSRADTDSMTYASLVIRFATKPAPTSERLNMLNLVRTKALSEYNLDVLPEHLRAELRRIVPGIAGQESHFDPTRKSSVACGLFGFRPTTLKESLKLPSHADVDPFDVELQIRAIGAHFVNIYKYLNQASRSALAQILADYFNGDKESFERQFLLPIMVNAYNTGQGTLSKIVNRFVELHHTDSHAVHGFNVYELMRREVAADRDVPPGNAAKKYPLVTSYGLDSSQYTPRVFALAQILEKQP